MSRQRHVGAEEVIGQRRRGSGRAERPVMRRRQGKGRGKGVGRTAGGGNGDASGRRSGTASAGDTAATASGGA